MGKTRSGKSTLVAALAEKYHELHPHHILWFIDLKGKGRFLPVERRPGDTLLFPDGFRARNVGGRDVVPIIAEELGSRIKWPEDGDVAHVIHDKEMVPKLCDWLYRHSTVDRPSFVIADETVDLMHGNFRSMEGVRKIFQHGGELGIGIAVLNQMPSYIDRTWITETEQLYISRLVQAADRQKMAEASTVPGAWQHLQLPMPRFSWLFLDQEYERMAKFRLGSGGPS